MRLGSAPFRGGGGRSGRSAPRKTAALRRSRIARQRATPNATQTIGRPTSASSISGTPKNSSTISTTAPAELTARLHTTEIVASHPDADTGPARAAGSRRRRQPAVSLVTVPPIIVGPSVHDHGIVQGLRTATGRAG